MNCTVNSGVCTDFEISPNSPKVYNSSRPKYVARNDCKPNKH